MRSLGAARKWGPWLLLLVAAGAILAFGVSRGGGRPSLDARVQHIASEVRCPVCHGQTVAQSEAAPSVEIRNEIRADLQKGEPEDQILAGIVASYGPGILEKPAARGIGLLVWVLPVVGVVVAGAGLLFAFRRWSRPGSAAVGPAVPAAAAASVADPARPAPVPADPLPGSTAVTSGRGRWPRRTRLAVAGAGVALVAGGASWAVVASSGTRLPGQEITGQSLGSEAVLTDLQAAQTDEQKGDAVGAIKLYQKVLASDRNQVEALSGEGWLLAQTGQPGLLKQGLSLLVAAERAQPGYQPAHVYRGLALLAEGDYSDSVPELQWYLDHGPDPQLEAGVRKALAQAQAGKAAAAQAAPASTAPSGQ